MSLSLLIWVLESLVNLTPSSNEWIAAAAAKSLQSCPTLCDPIDGSPPGSPIPGILQTRTLEQVVISFSNAWKWKVKVKLLGHVQTFSDLMDCSLPGSSVHGIFQARVQEWVAISFSNAWKRKAKMKSVSHVRLLATPWTAAYQAPPSMGFSRQEYRSGVLLPSLFHCSSMSNIVFYKSNGQQQIGGR